MINIILTSVQNTENFLIYASIPKTTKFPPEEVLSTSGGNSIFITRKFQRHREGEKPNFLSVCYRKKKIKSRV